MFCAQIDLMIGIGCCDDDVLYIQIWHFVIYHICLYICVMTMSVTDHNYVCCFCFSLLNLIHYLSPVIRKDH